MAKATFTRKEIAFLIDAMVVIQNMDRETKQACGMTEKRLGVMLFKLWRIFDSEKGIIC